MSQLPFVKQEPSTLSNYFPVIRNGSGEILNNAIEQQQQQLMRRLGSPPQYQPQHPQQVQMQMQRTSQMVNSQRFIRPSQQNLRGYTQALNPHSPYGHPRHPSMTGPQDFNCLRPVQQQIVQNHQPNQQQQQMQQRTIPTQQTVVQQLQRPQQPYPSSVPSLHPLQQNPPPGVIQSTSRRLSGSSGTAPTGPPAPPHHPQLYGRQTAKRTRVVGGGSHDELPGPYLSHNLDRVNLAQVIYSVCNLVPSFKVFVEEFLENGGTELLKSRESSSPWYKHSGSKKDESPTSSTPLTDALAKKKFEFPKQSESSRRRAAEAKKLKKKKELKELCSKRIVKPIVKDCKHILDRLTKNSEGLYSVQEFYLLENNPDPKATLPPPTKPPREHFLSASKSSPKRTQPTPEGSPTKSLTGVKPASAITGQRPGPLSSRLNNASSSSSVAAAPSVPSPSESRTNPVSFTIGGAVTISSVKVVETGKSQPKTAESLDSPESRSQLSSKSPPSVTSEKSAPSAVTISTLASRLPQQQISVTSVLEPEASPHSSPSGVKSSTPTRPVPTSVTKTKSLSDSVTISPQFAVKKTTTPFKKNPLPLESYRSGDVVPIGYKSSDKVATSPKRASPPQTEIILKRPGSADREQHKKPKLDAIEKSSKPDLDKPKHPEVTITPRVLPTVAEVQDSRIDSSGWKSPGSAPAESPVPKSAGEKDILSAGSIDINCPSPPNNAKKSTQVLLSSDETEPESVVIASLSDVVQISVANSSVASPCHSSTLVEADNDPRREPTFRASLTVLKIKVLNDDRCGGVDNLNCEPSYAIDLKKCTTVPLLRNVEYDDCECLICKRIGKFTFWRNHMLQEHASTDI